MFCTILLSLFAFFLTGNVRAQTVGCTDPQAGNFMPTAEVNDGSCNYGPTFHNPPLIGRLHPALRESSGLMKWNNLIWTHNDSGHEPVLYAFKADEPGTIVHEVSISNATNIDWEDITRDDTYCYIGDIGNNNGNRRNLRIYKLPLESLDHDTAEAEVIEYHYPDQTSFESHPNDNNFDAEALISMGDSLYIFSKNWRDFRTRRYALPKSPGTYAARLIDEIFVDGMITGGDYNEDENVVVLCGYNITLSPFVWLLWDFKEKAVFSGNRRLIRLNLPLHQVEAIVQIEPGKYLMSNEEFSIIGHMPAAVYELNTVQWVPIAEQIAHKATETFDWTIYPNPFSDTLQIRLSRQVKESVQFFLFNSASKLVHNEMLSADRDIHSLKLPTGLANGAYKAQIFTAGTQYSKTIVKVP